MIRRPIMEFLLHDGLGLPERIFPILETLDKTGGVLFWCRKGEWRALGGSRLISFMVDHRIWERIEDGFVVADHPAPSFVADWDIAIPVSAELVRWLRQDIEQLGKTNTAAESSTE